MLHIISLGAGVQSSTMALMAAHGELTPMPDAAIFADTQAEPASLYRWLDWLESQLPFPVYRVTRGNLGEAAVKLHTSQKGRNYTKSSIPAFVVDGDGKRGLLMRQCTSDYKIDVIHRKLREIRGGKHIFQWIGISVDEADRMKPSRKSYITNIWPLIDKRLSRFDCLQWIRAKNYPIPPRSACVFCPYHSNDEWRRLRNYEPEAFQAAVMFERKLQTTMAKVFKFRGVPFLHRSLKPLTEVDFSESQGSLFGNECEGMCGV